MFGLRASQRSLLVRKASSTGHAGSCSHSCRKAEGFGRLCLIHRSEPCYGVVVAYTLDTSDTHELRLCGRDGDVLGDIRVGIVASQAFSSRRRYGPRIGAYQMHSSEPANAFLTWSGYFGIQGF